MSFKNYDGLKEEIQSFLWDRSDVVAKIPSFIELAESEMRREITGRNSTFRRPFTAAGPNVSIPCDAGVVYGVTLSCGRELTYTAPENITRGMDDLRTGRPLFYTVDSGKIRLFPFDGSEGVSGEIVYRGPFCALSSQNKSNWILEQHPDIYLCGALKWAKRWLIDQDQDWDSPFYAAIKRANAALPRVQSNTKLRANDVTRMAGRRGFNIWTGGYN